MHRRRFQAHLSDAAGPSNVPVAATPCQAHKTAPRLELRWSSYIHKVLKEVHPDLHINKAGVTVLSDALNDLMERLAKECKHLVQSNERATLTARDVEAAVRLLIPPRPGRAVRLLPRLTPTRNCGLLA